MTSPHPVPSNFPRSRAQRLGFTVKACAGHVGAIGKYVALPTTALGILDMLSPLGPWLFMVAVLLFAAAALVHFGPAGLKKVSVSFLLVLAVVFAVAGIGNMIYREQGGVIAHFFPKTKTWQDTLLYSIKEDTRVIKDKADSIHTTTQTILNQMQPQNPREQLLRLGYNLDTESKAKAMEACDLAAIALYLELGERMPLAAPVFGLRGGSTLEAPILGNHDKFAEMMAVLSAGAAIDKAGLNQRYSLTFTQAGTAKVPAFEGLREHLMRRGAQLVQPATLKATPLLVAVWANSPAAISALVQAGADPDAPGVSVETVEIKDAMKGQVIHSDVLGPSAKQEAQRLGVAWPQ